MTDDKREHETGPTPTGTDADGPVPVPTGTGQGGVTDRPIPADGTGSGGGNPTGNAGNTPDDGSAPGDVDLGPGAVGADDAPAASSSSPADASAGDDGSEDDPDEDESGAVAEPAPDEPDWKDRYVRSVAELDNVRKRARRDAAAGEARGISRLAKELLPALDNLDRALAHVDGGPSDPDGPSTGDAQLVEGLRIVHREIHAALSHAGIEAYDPTGEQFDPFSHEALTQQPAPEGTAPGTILAVYQAGYRRGDDVLRAAKVVVAG